MNHKKYTLPVLFVILGCAVVAGVSGFVTANAQNGEETMHAVLRGNEQVPAVQSSGSGTFHLTLSPDRSSASYALQVRTLNSVTAAHLHCGSRGQNGPAIVPLAMGSGSLGVSNILPAAASCNPNIRTLEQLVQAIREGNIYANVHTTAHPDGEIRGQVVVGTMPNDYYMNGSMATTTIVSSRDLLITEVSPATTNSRTFMITISNDMLSQLNGILRNFMSFIDTQQFRFPQMPSQYQWTNNYNVNAWYTEHMNH